MSHGSHKLSGPCHGLASQCHCLHLAGDETPGTPQGPSTCDSPGWVCGPGALSCVQCGRPSVAAGSMALQSLNPCPVAH